MTSKTTTTITIETHQRRVVRRRGGHIVAWCERCRDEVLMLKPEEAAAIAHTTAREIFRRVESGEIHSGEAAGGALLICESFRQKE